MENKNKVLSLLGIMQRARRLVLGTDFTIDGVRSKKTYLVFLASDSSENTKKKVKDKCNFYSTVVIDQFTSLELSTAIGKIDYFVIGVNDEKCANSMKEYLREE